MSHARTAGTTRTPYTPTKAATSYDELPVMLTCEQAAAVAGVSRKHVRNLLAKGDLNGTRLGTCWRIPRDSFLQAIGLKEG